ncbi:MAG: TetR family transcriptional regulator [Candidatus Hydrogenedens sp.]|nr:TetR family transcriptional regulator [Candidatus Hydrogenedens sp.]
MPKIIDHDVMRAELIGGSYALFARDGFHAVTMRQLAKELGVSTGTLYHYFENKSDLFMQMFRHLVERDIGDALAKVADAHTPIERVRGFFEYVQEREEHLRRMVVLFFDFQRQQSGQHDAPQDFLRVMIRAYRETITSNLGVSDMRLGHMAMSLILGTLMQRLVDPEGAPLDEVRAFLEETIQTA